MQNIIIQIIKEIQSQKQAEDKAFTASLLLEVQAEIRNRFLRELSEMERAGIIQTGNTINDKYIKLNV